MYGAIGLTTAREWATILCRLYAGHLLLAECDNHDKRCFERR
jgi:hypothetical protein